MALMMRAYSMGGGTYTGLEAVSNGLMIMREPKVQSPDCRVLRNLWRPPRVTIVNFG